MTKLWRVATTLGATALVVVGTLIYIGHQYDLRLEIKNDIEPVRMSLDLSAFFEAYHRYYLLFGSSPQSLDDLLVVTPDYQEGCAVAASGRYAIRWGLDPSDGDRCEAHVLAYSNTVARDGGPILFTNGTIVTFDSQEAFTMLTAPH